MYENKVILLMTTAEKKWHYLAVKSFSAILHGIKLKYLIANKFNSSFYCINYFHSFKTENKLILYKNICINHDYSYKKKHEIHNVLTWSLYLKQLRWYKDPEKTTTTKLNKHTACGYSLFTHCSSDRNKNKHDYYRGEDCMKKKNVKKLKESATKIRKFLWCFTIVNICSLIYKIVKEIQSN